MPFRPARRDRYGLGALASYFAISFAIIGRSVVGHLTTYYIGRSNDPTVYMWMLRWWPYAIEHRLNPMLTRVIWAPAGFNLAWTTPMPLLAILAWPFTAAVGPVATYNILCIVAPASAAWTCFLLCRKITGSYLPALIGGCVFGFSGYVLAEVRGHLLLVFVFPLPLLVLLTLHRFDGRLSGWQYTLLTGALLASTFLFWPELYATMTFFGAAALGLSLALYDSRARSRMGNLIIPLAGAYAISMTAVLPYLYYFFQPGYPRAAINSPAAYSADLLNVVVPTPIHALGTLSVFQDISRNFSANLLEAGAYIGLPSIAILVWFGWTRWHQASTRMLIAFAVLVFALMLGPRLHVGGTQLFGMPWKLAMHLPLLRHALPVRFSIYAFLALAVVVSVWFAEQRPLGLKVAALSLLAIFLCPNLGPDFGQPDDTPAFFTGSDFRSYLSPDENVIILPVGVSMLRQATATFYFRMADGWTGLIPRDFQRWPIVNALFTATMIPDATGQLCSFMATHDVRAVIVDDRGLEFWAAMLSQLDPAPARVGGVTVYRPSPARLERYRTTPALEMERRNDQARFATLLAAGRAYVASARDVAQLTPMRAQQLGLLPPHWVRDPDVRTNNGLYLGPWSGDRVAVGVVGTYEGLQPLIARYGKYSGQVFFPFPKMLAQPPQGDTFMRLLVMVFDRKDLSRAATESIRAVN